MLTGAGAVQAFDSREGSQNPSSLEGLLDSTTYIAGLSGGGWLVGSVYVCSQYAPYYSIWLTRIVQLNNFSTISSLLDNGPSATSDLWNFSNPVISGPSDSAAGQQQYFTILHQEIQSKTDAGYNTTFADYWGQALAFQLVNASQGGPSYTWSSIRNDSDFAQSKSPFPLLTADGRLNGQFSLDSTTTTVFEFNPFEFGTWDPTNYGFVDVQFLGSNFSNGSLAEGEQCVRGFDNGGFVLGTTSAIYDSLIATALTSQLPTSVQTILGSVINETVEDKGLISVYQPNPFKDWDITGQAPDASDDALDLVDGGTDDQNIPFQPLIQPARAVDIIVAIDSSSDTLNNWPNGSAMVATYERALNASGIANHTAFPSVPDPNTFINLGLNSRPTFFGCNASNSSEPTPLVVYIPNTPYSYYSNISTLQIDVNTTERDALVANGYQVATLGNATANKEFKACLGCAILSRSFDRTGTTVPEACSSCFNQFCWNGTVNSTIPSPYNPILGTLGKSGGNAGGNGTSSGGGSSNGSSSGGQFSGSATQVQQVSVSLAFTVLASVLFLYN